MDNPDSLQCVLDKWVHEVKHFCKGVPIFLVACRKDLRKDPRTIEELAKNRQKPVSKEEGNAVARQIGAYKYMQCSAKLGEGVKELFTEAARAALHHRSHKQGCIII